MRGERIFRPFFDAINAPEPLRNFVLTELAAPRRRWHGLFHHLLMLRAIVRSGHGASGRRRLIAATLFHDIVYDATRPDNEEASAEVARQWLGADGDAAVPLILATKAHDLASADPVTRTLLEADLAVLWTPSPALYAFYARGIRSEYGHVPDAAYRAGRAAVLDGLRSKIAPELEATRRRRLDANLEWERRSIAAGAFDGER